ncbi:light-harvesting antenna LH1, alpha subunit [Rhodospira trueperi]|jgi:light-harvesting complex 1 alpha chain|uniref:Light-harvesting complex 1 alpha chain n=1 Tax=Rhodospira trueperi TaxID=69960 RepID=A0A1G6ZW47_9PROT|nr:light-harvesting antenna LH1, alpha subunit [Rhodospira trueperi]SDE06593.1 light-harvesting complex 1 alpha chain [Rhodospira trueperi]
MHKLWMLLDPARTLVAIFVFQTLVGLLLHFMLLSTDRLNWWEGPQEMVNVVLPYTTMIS